MDSPEIIATTPTSEFITSFSDVSSSVSALSEENNEVTVSTQEFTSETSAETLAAETLISEVISESETTNTVIETLRNTNPKTPKNETRLVSMNATL